ncbi:heterokaryon incompatibility protein-domain-containing protein [Dichomitus squalens]|uniref:Heterokaryon incompatibility protein-domain-containing protein n=1 Tax=Dichomitus squalens TaxID=114155 RepID=A0A4Q9MW73_9APHY|nr:heterokaryon incompatibility protein-domain-containing protein [Dichomitus squalens]
MWLLSTERAELRYFSDPEQVPEGYAILSHVWDAKEASFQDLEELRQTCAITGTIPRDHAPDKVRQCCVVAERHGHLWIWNDTCCINKSSSSELSEALNSMFRYYSLAKVCYAYLRDVPTSDAETLRQEHSAFRTSRWHIRGWTLQELIAPAFLIFLSEDWEILGTKMEMSDVLEEITSVPATVLKMEKPISDVSVACRMAWAAKRQTTRVEDEAYCLMGIFSINMTTLYGEGRHAFQRLQEEIMRSSIDASLFAWEDAETSRLDLDYSQHSLMVPGHPQSCSHRAPAAYLLARSPADFSTSAGAQFVLPPSERLSNEVVPETYTTNLMTSLELAGIPTFSITPYGIHAHLKVMDISPSLSIGLISCVINVRGREDILGLFLSPCTSAMDSRRPLFHIGALDFHLVSHRTVLLGDTRSSVHIYHDSPLVSFPQWREIYITHRPPPSTTSLIPHIPSSCTISAPFRIPLPDIMKGLPDWILFTMTLTEPSWKGTPPMALTFKHTNGSYLVVILGICRRDTEHGLQPRYYSSPYQGSFPHWAIVFTPNERLSETPSHDCLRDHIRCWPRQRKIVPAPALPSAGHSSGSNPLGPAELTVSFSRCPISSGDTLVLNIKHCKLHCEYTSAGTDAADEDRKGRGDVSVMPHTIYILLGSEIL